MPGSRLCLLLRKARTLWWERLGTQPYQSLITASSESGQQRNLLRIAGYVLRSDIGQDCSPRFSLPSLLLTQKLDCLHGPLGLSRRQIASSAAIGMYICAESGTVGGHDIKFVKDSV